MISSWSKSDINVRWNGGFDAEGGQARGVRQGGYVILESLETENGKR